MAKQAINVGTTANDKKGDSLRAAFQKVNANFTELYTALGLDADTLNIGAFEFTGSTMTTTDSSAIVIDQATTITSNLSVGGDIVPQTALGGDLGSSTLPWRSLYVSNNTIYIGGTAVGLDANGNLTTGGTVVGSTPAWANITGKPTFATVATTGAYADLTGKPTIPTLVSQLANDSGFLTSAGNISNIQSESDVSIEINLSDSTLRRWRFGEDGSLTLPSVGKINNGAYDWTFGSTGITTFPGVINAGNINNLVVNDLGGGTSLTAGSQVQIGNSAGIAGAGVIIKNAVTNTLDGEFSSTLESGSKIQMDNGNVSLFGYTYTGIGDDSGLEGRLVVEVDNSYLNNVVRIGTRTITTNGGDTITSFQGVTFSRYGELTFPDNTVQTTAYNPSNIRSEGNINIDINLADSTLRRWQFGEDGYLTLPNDSGINSSANINIAVNTPDSTTFNWQFGNDGNLTLPNDGGITASSNINISVATPDSTTLNWQFGNDGALTLPGPGKITNGDYDWKFDSDGFFNAASILTLGNSGNLYIDKISTQLGNGSNIRQRGFRIDQYNNITTYSATTRKTATGLTPVFTSTADPTVDEYYEVIAELRPNLAANENFTVGIQMPTLNPFAAGWMAAYPDDAKQYKFKLIFQATYVIQGVTYNFIEAYETIRETFGDSSEPTQEINITTQVQPPLPSNPSGDEITPMVNLDLNPLVAGYVTVKNFGTAFARARGAAGLVPVQLAVSAGFSRNLDVALVWGRANTGTTLTNPNTSFDGIAYYQGIGDNAIVTDYNYMQMVLGPSYIVFQPNNIQLANGTNIGENLNGSMVFGNRYLENSLGAVAIGTGYGTIGDYAVAMGRYAGSASGESAVAVGNSAGENQGAGAVAIGPFAGANQSASAVAVGNSAGGSQGASAVAVGSGAGANGQNTYAVAIGANAGSQSQGTNAVAMGYGAGYYGQRDNAVAIGSLAGAGTVYAMASYVAAGSTGTTLIISRAVYATGTIVPGMMIQATGFSDQTVVAVVSATELTISAAPDTALVNGLGLLFFKGQGANSIAIGNQAGSPYGDVTVDFQESNTIILNATGTSLMGVDGQENSFYVAPIRNAISSSGLLQYNATTKEVTYGSDIRSETGIYIDVNLSDSTLYRWQFGEDGNLTLPQGGNISEGGGLTGAIRLTPSGGANANQALMIYPTAGGDGDHIHLTAGGGTTELYLGNDTHYVKLGKGAGYNGTIIITATGRPDTVSGIISSTGNWAVVSLSNLATTGGTGTGLTVTVTQVAGVATAIAIVSGAMEGYTSGDTITVTSGAATATFIIGVLAPEWVFAPDGDLYIPSGNTIRKIGSGEDIRSIPGPYADDAAAAAASVAVGYPYHKTGTGGQVFVRLT